MKKFKAGDIVLIKDDFLRSLKINPIEISNLEVDESEKDKGDYYIPADAYRLKLIYEKDVMAIESLGTMEKYLSNGEYCLLKDFFKDNAESVINNDRYSYLGCDVELFSKIRTGDHLLLVNLLSGTMGNVIELGIMLGKYLELKKIEIEKIDTEYYESLRKQSNEDAENNKRWNDDQTKYNIDYEEYDRENGLNRDDEYNPNNWEGRC